MNAVEEYQRQVELMEWVDNRFRGEYPIDRRTNIVLCCFDLTLEHHASICLLHTSELYGSMFSLFRVLYESFIRGLYFWLCATESEIDLFERKEKIEKNFGQLIESIEQKIDLENGPFSKLKDSAYKIMNSFTHTGYQHLVRRQNNKHTGAINYPDEERSQLLRCTGALVLQAAAYLAALQNNSELTEEVINKIKEYAKA